MLKVLKQAFYYINIIFGIKPMAKNPPIGDGHRQGAVKNRSQTFNPKTESWVKRNKDNGQFMDLKSDNKKFKGVIREK